MDKEQQGTGQSTMENGKKAKARSREDGGTEESATRSWTARHRGRPKNQRNKTSDGLQDGLRETKNSARELDTREMETDRPIAWGYRGQRDELNTEDGEPHRERWGSQRTAVGAGRRGRS